MTALLCSLGGREGMGTTQGVAHALTVRVVCVCSWALTLFSRTASLFAGCLWYMCLEQSSLQSKRGAGMLRRRPLPRR